MLCPPGKVFEEGIWFKRLKEQDSDMENGYIPFTMKEDPNLIRKGQML